jgi:hypothetical protein
MTLPITSLSAPIPVLQYTDFDTLFSAQFHSFLRMLDLQYHGIYVSSNPGNIFMPQGIYSAKQASPEQ